MGVLVEVVKPLLFAALNSCHTKRLVCELLDRYVQTTDNDVDNLISNTVRTALLKNCWYLNYIKKGEDFWPLPFLLNIITT